jgi:hypothetical protein
MGGFLLAPQLVSQPTKKKADSHQSYQPKGSGVQLPVPVLLVFQIYQQSEFKENKGDKRQNH